MTRANALVLAATTLAAHLANELPDARDAALHADDYAMVFGARVAFDALAGVLQEASKLAHAHAGDLRARETLHLAEGARGATNMGASSC